MYAYTPGLKIVKSTKIERERVLPIPGEILVQKGDSVTFNQNVAQTQIPSGVVGTSLSMKLGINPSDLPAVMLKKIGDPINKGELLAVSKSFFGLVKHEYRSNVTGVIELISDVSGHVFTRLPMQSLFIDAYISGKVNRIIPNLGAVIETQGAIVQGIFGIGGERQGELVIISGRDDVVTEDHIDRGLAGKIAIGGSLLTLKAMEKSMECGLKGVIVGGIEKIDFDAIAGSEIGVAITGKEKIDTTFIVTEGCSKMKMAEHTYDILKSLEGEIASINGTTQIRAGVIRPEIIVPERYEDLQNIDVYDEKMEEPISGFMNVGSEVRIIRSPYFGEIGKVIELPIETMSVESESQVRVVNIELEKGEIVTVPRANVELMEK